MFLPSAAVTTDAPDALYGRLATEALAARARAERELLAYPERPWVTPRPGPDGAPLVDVLIVGGGQSGLGIAAALQQQAVERVVVLDRAPAGREGVWDSYARMPELRTPKRLNGLDLGLASLSVQQWFIVRHGRAAWDAIERLPREAWHAYLQWYRETLGLAVENGLAVTDLRPAGDGVIAVDTQPVDAQARAVGPVATRHARWVVLATGMEGAGAWRLPTFLAEALPAARCVHACGPVDFEAMAGRRVAVLGHGASAFDHAVRALEAGAASVDLCFRRERLPRVNPHRALETAGLMSHYDALSDATRWQIARHFRLADQPPPPASFARALAMPGFRLHAGRPWTAARWTGDEIVLDTPHGALACDHVIAATGLVPDLSARPEWRTLRHHVRLWGDAPPPMPAGHVPDAIDAALGAYPVLDAHYGCVPRTPGADDWVSRVLAFNGASYVSHGPHSTSISGHKHALPRLVRGLTRRLFREEEGGLVDALRAWDLRDLDLPDDFEARVRARHAATLERRLRA